MNIPKKFRLRGVDINVRKMKNPAWYVQTKLGYNIEEEWLEGFAVWRERLIGINVNLDE